MRPPFPAGIDVQRHEGINVARVPHRCIRLPPLDRHPHQRAWIFHATDTDAARHWDNETCHRHLIPATQAGVKIPVQPDGQVGQIHAVTRLIIPGKTCMWCDGLINSTKLAIDMHPAAERVHARYLEEVPAPSVIALNNVAVAEAVNHFVLAVTGLHTDDADTASVMHRPRSRDCDLLTSRHGP